MFEKLEPVGNDKVVERSEAYPLNLKLWRKEKRKNQRKEYNKNNIDAIEDNQRKGAIKTQQRKCYKIYIYILMRTAKKRNNKEGN